GGWRAVEIVRQSGTGGARLRQRHRGDHQQGGFARSDLRGADSAVGSFSRRSRLLFGGAAVWVWVGCAFSAGGGSGLCRDELARHDQGLPFSLAPDRLLVASEGHAASGAGRLPIGVSHFWAAEHHLHGTTAALAIAHSPRCWPRIQG